MHAGSIELLHRAGAVGFLDELRALAVDAPTPWPHADDPLLIGLERWGRALGERDLAAAALALVAAAQHGLPIARAAGGAAFDELAVFEDVEAEDGAAIEAQLAIAAAHARAGTAASQAVVDSSFDRGMQLNIWSDDLLPTEEGAYCWYLEVGQCALAALRSDDGHEVDDAHESYYYWTRPVVIGRGLVVAARGLRLPGVALDEIVAALGQAIAAAA